MRIRQINFKVSDREREVLNSLIIKKRCSLSDIIREAIKEHYQLEEFDASFTETANKIYKSKWRIYWYGRERDSSKSNRWILH